MEAWVTNLGDYLSLWLSWIINKNGKSKYIEDSNDSRWSTIPPDIMGTIIGMLHPTDKVRMSCVCRSWRKSITLHQNLWITTPDMPWLLLPDFSNCKIVSFYSLCEGRIYNLELPRGGRICGYSKGWLMLVRGLETYPIIFLLNPVSGVEIRLPSFRTIPHFDRFINTVPKQLHASDFVCRIEISSSPNTENCVVAAIFSYFKVLALCMPGDEEWTFVESGYFHDDDEEDYYEDLSFQDILFYNKSLYVSIKAEHMEEEEEEEEVVLMATHTFPLQDCEVTLNLIPLHIVLGINGFVFGTHAEIGQGIRVYKDRLEASYFVDSIHGELLRIHHFMDVYAKPPVIQNEQSHDRKLIYPQTKGFEIFKINPITGHMDRLTSLGEDQVIFLATCGGSLSTSLKNIHGFKGNCIYFAAAAFQQSGEYPFYKSRECGVFHLEDGRIERSFPSIELPIQSRICWFTPCL